MRSARLISVIAIALAVLAGTDVRAQKATDLVIWKGSLRQANDSQQYTLHLGAEIADGWKMYALDSPRPSRGVEIRVSDLPEGAQSHGMPRQSAPKDAFDPNFRMDVRYFVQSAKFEVDVETAAAELRGEISGSLTFQICNDDLGICLPPTDVSFAVPADGSEVTLVSDCDPLLEDLDEGECEILDLGRSSTAVAGGSDSGPLVSGVGRSDYAPRRGMLPFLMLAFGAGLAALLTPCVFPMIPLTVSYFAKHAENRRRAAGLAAIYGGAIVTTFTGLGVIMALIVGAAGAQTIAANPWVNLFIAGILIAFALSLLGMFELRLPSGIVNYFSRRSSGPGYVGVLFMGFTITLVSFSCTAPFVGGLLAATAGGEWFYPMIGMVAFSAAFATPFVLLSLFPSALYSIPRSGSWMNAFKVTLGFIELAAAIKFLSNADLVWQWDLISRPLAIAVTVVIFALAGFYLIGKLRLAGESVAESIGVGRLIAGVAFFGLAMYMLPGLLGAPLNRLDAYLPPRQATDVSLLGNGPSGTGVFRTADGGEGWIEDDIDFAMDQGASLGLPVFIDFTGYTCTNCREMESNVFVQPPVAERFERNFVRLRLFTDTIENGQEYQRYQLRTTGTVALPTYAIVDPVQKSLIARDSGVMSMDDFVRFLDAATAAYLDGSLALR